MSRLTLLSGVLSLLVSAACSTRDLPTSASAVTSAGPDLASTTAKAEVSTSATDGSAFLAPVRHATAAYHNVSKAVADGYLAPNAAECVASPAGAMGVHSVNPILASDQTIDPARPEALLYLPKSGGGFRLVGVEYIQTVLVRNKLTGAVSPWFAPTPWPPAEYDVVTPRPSVLGHAFDGPMAGHEPGMPWHFDLHVWAWAPNPAGDFAQFNPSFACAGEAHH
jgi:hypothetical protein